MSSYILKENGNIITLNCENINKAPLQIGDTLIAGNINVEITNNELLYKVFSIFSCASISVVSRPSSGYINNR